MAAIDYEAEYNNRARVPDHQEIFAGWARDAEEYRLLAMEERRAELGLAYSSTPRQFIDLFWPTAEEKAPLALFIHGGYWKSLEPAQFSQVARGLNARGIGVAVAGYNLCPTVTISDIIEEMRHACLFLWQRTGQRILVYGHSAGGHLAAAMVATDWHQLYPKMPADFIPAGYAISGLYDLTPLLQVASASDIGLDADEARRASPILWPAPAGRTFDAVVGADESSEFLRQSRDVAEVWKKGGADTRYEEIPGANHFNILAPLSDPNSAMVSRLVELAKKI